nr:uncharacterized protein LOC129058885 [Pongo abelii]
MALGTGGGDGAGTGEPGCEVGTLRPRGGSAACRARAAPLGCAGLRARGIRAAAGRSTRAGRPGSPSCSNGGVSFTHSRLRQPSAQSRLHLRVQRIRGKMCVKCIGNEGLSAVAPPVPSAQLFCLPPAQSRGQARRGLKSLSSPSTGRANQCFQDPWSGTIPTGPSGGKGKAHTDLTDAETEAHGGKIFMSPRQFSHPSNENTTTCCRASLRKTQRQRP